MSFQTFLPENTLNTQDLYCISQLKSIYAAFDQKLLEYHNGKDVSFSDGQGRNENNFVNDTEHWKMHKLIIGYGLCIEKTAAIVSSALL